MTGSLDLDLSRLTMYMNIYHTHIVINLIPNQSPSHALFLLLKKKLIALELELVGSLLLMREGCTPSIVNFVYIFLYK